MKTPQIPAPWSQHGQIEVVQIHSCDKCGNEKPKDDEILCVQCKAEAHAARMEWNAGKAIQYAYYLLTACNCHEEAAAIEKIGKT